MKVAMGSKQAPESEAISGQILSEADALRRELLQIRAEMAMCQPPVGIHQDFRSSAINLLHYLSLRRHDLRSIQDRLAELGLSSLGRAEPHVLATLDSVLNVLGRLGQTDGPPLQPVAGAPNFREGRTLLNEHTTRLLGPAPSTRKVRIMVTMPSEAAHDYRLIHDLVRQGMDCMRINCAHDSVEDWGAMIDHLRRAEKSLGVSCRVVMDLGGPKVRTGPLAPGRNLLKVRPRRDELGRICQPARIWLYPADKQTAAPSAADGALPVSEDWIAAARVGEDIDFVDSRQAKRRMVVVDKWGGGLWAELHQTAV